MAHILFLWFSPTTQSHTYSSNYHVLLNSIFFQSQICRSFLSYIYFFHTSLKFFCFFFSLTHSLVFLSHTQLHFVCLSHTFLPLTKNLCLTLSYSYSHTLITLILYRSPYRYAILLPTLRHSVTLTLSFTHLTLLPKYFMALYTFSSLILSHTQAIFHFPCCSYSHSPIYSLLFF